MNEPSNFDTDTYSGQPTSNNGRLACPITGPGSEFDNPPYQTYAALISSRVHHLVLSSSVEATIAFRALKPGSWPIMRSYIEKND
ncbi:hypothetical protein GCK32_021623 [Trichostrongylus colubriformis]|uniref:Uncharacterized protein n=1 Tax=Trichostrongylus colubriformis TaxID=6319 RepID=A0AAN8F909_TRICO